MSDNDTNLSSYNLGNCTALTPTPTNMTKDSDKEFFDFYEDVT